MRVGSLILGFAVLLGCAHLSREPSSIKNLAPDSQLVETYRSGLELIATQPAQACQIFTSLLQKPQFGLRDVADLRRRQSCPLSAQTALSWTRYSELVKTSPWLSDLALQIAVAHSQALKQTSDLIEIYLEKARLETHPPDKEALILKARALAQKTGDFGREKEIEKKLFLLAPRFNPQPEESELLLVAKDWRMARDFERAQKIYEKIIKSSKSRDDDRFRALVGLRTTLKVKSDQKGFLRLAARTQKFAERQWLKQKNQPAYLKRYYEASVDYVRAIWTDGHRDIGAQQLQKLAQRVQGLIALDEIYFLRARMEEEGAHFDQATEWLEKALAEKNGHASIREKIQWTLAWNLRKQKKFEQSTAVLADLRQSSISPFDQAKYRYWSARNLKDAGSKDKATLELQGLAQKDTLSYYGLLARGELGGAAEESPRFVASSDESATGRVFTSSADARYMEWLIVSGESSVSERFLEQVSRPFLSAPADYEDAAWVELLTLHDRAQLYPALLRLVNGLDYDLRSRLAKNHMELLFPRPYLPMVTQSASRHQVAAELIFAIMRQESSFDTHARSPADALGLMQLVPQAIKGVARHEGLGFKQADELYKPELNIQLGAALLKNLMRTYRGQVILTAASYNSSERAIRNWLRSRLREDPLEFIEDIPFEETRAYIKLVLRNLAFYNHYTQPTRPVVLPEWCLKNLQDFKG